MADNINSTTITTLAGNLAKPSNSAIVTTTTPISGTANTYSDMRLLEIIETNQSLQLQQQQLRQRNDIHNVLPTQNITITPTSSSVGPVRLLSTDYTQSAGGHGNTAVSVRRSARLQTRPQLPVVTTVADGSPSGVMNADQVIYFDADELQPQILQQQRLYYGGNNSLR